MVRYRGIATSGFLLSALAALAGEARAEVQSCENELFVSDPDPRGANLRAGPSNSAAILTRLKNYRRDGIEMMPQVTITGMIGAWLRVSEVRVIRVGRAEVDEDPYETTFRGEAWIHSSLTTIQVVAHGERDPGAPLRGGADEETRVVGRINSPSMTRVSGCHGKWLKVRTGSVEGWLHPRHQCRAQSTVCN